MPSPFGVGPRSATVDSGTLATAGTRRPGPRRALQDDARMEQRRLPGLISQRSMGSTPTRATTQWGDLVGAVLALLNVIAWSVLILGWSELLAEAIR